MLKFDKSVQYMTLEKDREHLKRSFAALKGWIKRKNIIAADANCGNANGFATIYVTGGTPEYSYLWSNGSESNYAGDLVEVRIKLRTPKGAWRVKMFKSYGANPTPMALSEVFVALQTGVIDGQENPFTQIYSQNFHEVQKYLSLSGHVYTPAYLLTGKKTWDSLPADVQKILQDEAVGMQEWVYETAAQMETDLLEKMKGSVEINEVDKQAFVDASGPIYDEFGSKVAGAKEMIDQIQALAK